ncbi:MAG TPA: DUF6079 family protein [Streptosporangiaceae bacterium]|nr:DUF6079 family protein [Streptosporangiaceae bacterium]
MTLISELIEVPEAVHSGDFVLNLAQGISQIDQTVADYVVTPELAMRFDEALSIIKSALTSGSSKAAYLDGSFGSGKSHFMAVLAALLANNPAARAKDDLAPVVQKYEPDVLGGKRYLMVPYHLVGKQSLEEAILGGYLSHVVREHPDAALPAVLLDAPLLDTAVNLRRRLGDGPFFGLLGKPADSGWGDLASGWDAARFDAALTAPPGSPERVALVGVLQDALSGFAELARSAGTGFVDIDDGLAAISQHAASLGYDALVLFLDELILWFATRMSDHQWVASEAPKVAKLVEAANAGRPVPIISFVARQRDLRELVGTSLPGAEHLAFADSLKWWEGRFSSVKLSDNNLPVIAGQRVLRPKSDAARGQIDSAFAAMDQVRQDIRSALMTTRADRDAFRLTYPFSPAFMETLVGLSGALQRERTALRVMQQLLVGQRNTLELGQIVPVSDLFDALVADDEPISGELGALWRNAQKVYGEIYRVILEGHGLTDQEASQTPATHAVHRDCRIAKTIVLAALMPEIESMRDLTGRKIVALNHGYIRAMVPGQEPQTVIEVVRRWAARLGTVQLSGDPASPVISVRLEGVDIEGVLENAGAADTHGARRQQIRSLLCEALGVSADIGLDGVLPVTSVWRGTRRTVELAFGAIRDPGDLGDAMFRPTHAGWRVVFGYPIDEQGHVVSEDLDRAAGLRQRQPARTVCWVPRRLTSQTVFDLGRYVRLRYALGPSFDQLAGHLSDNDRAIARQQMTALAEQLRGTLTLSLLQAYGVITPDDAVVDTAHGGAEMFVSLEPGLSLRVPGGAGLRQVLDSLQDQLLNWEFPGHPPFPAEVRRPDLQKVHAQVRRAIEEPEHRVMVESGERPLMRRIANPLRLGEQFEQYFLLGHHWENHFNRKIAEARSRGGDVTVGDLRAWLDDPQPMGLPQEIADLVIEIFAEQTNRGIIVAGRPVDVSVLQPLPADAPVTEQPLPGEDDWTQARERAQALFGIGNISELRTARNVSVLVGRVREQAASLLPAARQLRDMLIERGPVVLGAAVDPASTSRARIADAAVRLCEELAAVADDLALIRVLASFELPGAALHLGRSLATAPDVVRAAERVDWPIYVSVAGWKAGHRLGPQARSLSEQLAAAWEANEYAMPLQPALAAADSAARRLLLEADRAGGSGRPDNGLPGAGQPEAQQQRPGSHSVPAEAERADSPAADVAESGDRDIDAGSLGEVTAILASLTRAGKRVHVTWRVSP